jgi:hypothetical protein
MSGGNAGYLLFVLYPNRDGGIVSFIVGYAIEQLDPELELVDLFKNENID